MQKKKKKKKKASRISRQRSFFSSSSFREMWNRDYKHRREKEKGRRKMKWKRKTDSIRGNFSLTNPAIHTQNPRARNIKKHFEETKAQRGKGEGEVGWKIETIATRGYEEQSGIPSNSSGKSVTRYGWIAPLVRRGRNAAEFVIFPFKADRKNSRPSGRSGARRAEESAFYRGPWKFARKSIHRSVGRKRLLDFSRVSRLLFLPPLLSPLFFLSVLRFTCRKCWIWILLLTREHVFVFSNTPLRLIFILKRDKIW